MNSWENVFTSAGPWLMSIRAAFSKIDKEGKSKGARFEGRYTVKIEGRFIVFVLTEQNLLETLPRNVSDTIRL